MPSRPRIVLVEDLADDQFFIERALKDGGLDAALAVVEDEAPLLGALLEFRPDIVLTDHRMPRLSAWRVLELARQRSPQLPVVVVTGAMREAEEAEAMRLGARAVVRKDDLGPLAGIVRGLVPAGRG